FLIFTILVYTPIQIIGLINWIKNKQDNTVLTKSLSFLSGMGLTVLVIVCSFLLGFLLTLIPGQNLAFLDSSSQIINLCGVFLMSIRHREAWYVWLMNNTVDLIIWIINISNNSTYSQMAFIVSVMYFVMNIISLILWIKIEKKQKEKVA
ncbi:MAG: nicotinamide mononucleotide transporter, partial [Clostridia bacterium]|nr:nicotinamide mononucleotide transporter [Clostridia bacterium]